jgi:urate oxidase
VSSVTSSETGGATTGRIVLGQNNYGKGEVRLVKVFRHPGHHDVRDLRVDVALEGDFEAAHVKGDNTGLLATDTMRNTVYALAKEHLVGSLESFGEALGARFVAIGPTGTSARIRLKEFPWTRLEAGDQPHPHGFQRGSGGNRVATVRVTDAGASFEAGIEDLLVLKTTGSGWAGFLRDEYTSLPETSDRIMATMVTGTWEYTGTDHDFDGLWHAVRDTILATFDDHFSPSVQMTLYRMGEAVLEGHPEVARIRFSLPNKHHLLYDLGRFGMTNEQEIFHASSEPWGLIEGTVERAA